MFHETSVKHSEFRIVDGQRVYSNHISFNEGLKSNASLVIVLVYSNSNPLTRTRTDYDLYQKERQIVATLGPASNTPDSLKAVLEAGVDVCQINCSHSTAQSIRSTIAMIRHCAAQLHRSVAILLDLQGPKIRTGTIEPPLMLQKDDILTIVMSKTYEHQGTKIGTTWTTMAEDVAIDDPVLFADGALSGTVTDVRFSDNAPAEVDIRIEVGGELKSRKGINLPASNIKAPALTPKDEADLAVGVAAGVDYVALSFVRHAQDMTMLKTRLEELGHPDLPTMIKIGSQGVDNIEEILDLASGIMVARVT